MESQTQTQTTPNTLPTIEKLHPYGVYKFTQCKEIQTKFARSAFIVYDEETKTQYWANARLTTYIKAHLDNYEKQESGEYIINPPLSVITTDERTFMKFGMEIHYLDLHIEGSNPETHIMEPVYNRRLEESSKYTFVKSELIDTKYGKQSY